MTTSTFYANEDDGFLGSIDEQTDGSANYALARAGTGDYLAVDLYLAPAYSNNGYLQVGQYAWDDGGVENFTTYQQVHEGFIRFDSSAIADGDTVDSATLSLYLTDDKSLNAEFTVRARLLTWAALTTADWRTTYAETLLATINTSGIGAVNAYKDFTSESAFPANVSKTGYTEMVLFSSRTESGTSPGDPAFDQHFQEYLRFRSANQTGTTEDPKLVVVHTGSTQNASVTPNPVVGTAVVANAFAYTEIAHIVPAAVVGAATIPTPTVLATRDASVTPAAVVGTASVPTPTVTAGASPKHEVLHESHLTHNDAHFEMYGVRRAAQTFTAPKSHSLVSVDVGVHIEGTPPNPLTVAIYALDGNGFPTGSALGSGSIPVAGAPTSEGSLVHVAISPAAQVLGSVTYAIVCSTTGGDASNDWHWTYDSSAADYANGQKLTDFTGSNWSAQPTHDFIFQEYGALTVIGFARFPTDVVSAGASVTPAAVAVPTVVPDPTVAGGTDITPAAVVGAATVPTPTVEADANIIPAAVVGTATVPTPTVTVAGNAEVIPSPVVGTAVVQTPTVHADASVTPDAVGATASVPTPVVAAGLSVTPAAVVGTAFVPIPTVSAIRNASVVPSPVAGTAFVQTPIVSAGGTINVIPSAVVGAAQVPTPTVSAGASLTPNAVPATATVPQPTVRADASVTPAAVVGTAFIPTPVVSVGGGASVVPTAVVGTGTVPTPTVTATRSASVIPTPVMGTASVPTPTILVGGSASVTPSPVVGTASVPTSVVTAGARTTPAAVVGTGIVVAPTVEADANVVVGPVAGTAVVPTIEFFVGVPLPLTGTTDDPREQGSVEITRWRGSRSTLGLDGSRGG